VISSILQPAAAAAAAAAPRSLLLSEPGARLFLVIITPFILSPPPAVGVCTRRSPDTWRRSAAAADRLPATAMSAGVPAVDWRGSANHGVLAASFVRNLTLRTRQDAYSHFIKRVTYIFGLPETKITAKPVRVITLGYFLFP